eukprot:680837-Prorocentrum_minimum.AAC.1
MPFARKTLARRTKGKKKRGKKNGAVCLSEHHSTYGSSFAATVLVSTAVRALGSFVKIGVASERA